MGNSGFSEYAIERGKVVVKDEEGQVEELRNPSSANPPPPPQETATDKAGKSKKASTVTDGEGG